MDGRDNNFGIDFAPIGQAIKKARIAQNMTREQLAVKIIVALCGI